MESMAGLRHSLPSQKRVDFDNTVLELPGFMLYLSILLVLRDGPSRPYRRVAILVDKILKDVKPDLSVDQPTKFEFVINLKTAKQIGLTFPPNVYLGQIE
jgi:hypothetical protein